jgi:hypothetical protein
VGLAKWKRAFCARRKVTVKALQQHKDPHTVPFRASLRLTMLTFHTHPPTLRVHQHTQRLTCLPNPFPTVPGRAMPCLLASHQAIGESINHTQFQVARITLLLPAADRSCTAWVQARGFGGVGSRRRTCFPSTVREAVRVTEQYSTAHVEVPRRL